MKRVACPRAAKAASPTEKAPCYAKPAEHFVEILERRTNKVVKRMGPMSYSKAERVMRGAYINMDSENFYTTIVDATPGVKAI